MGRSLAQLNAGFWKPKAIKKEICEFKKTTADLFEEGLQLIKENSLMSYKERKNGKKPQKHVFLHVI